jgi:hypothetical protein
VGNHAEIQSSIASLHDLGLRLFSGHIWTALISVSLQLIRTAMSGCEGFADELLEPLLLIRTRPFELLMGGRPIPTLARVVAAPSGPGCH